MKSDIILHLYYKAKEIICQEANKNASMSAQSYDLLNICFSNIKVCIYYCDILWEMLYYFCIVLIIEMIFNLRNRLDFYKTNKHFLYEY